MKLVVEEPSPWPVQTIGGKPIDLSRPLSLIIAPMEDRHDRWHRWRDRVLRVGLPEGATVDITSERAALSRLEWPVQLIDSTSRSAAGAVLETRITVLYFMLEWCAAVVMRGAPERVAAERDRGLRVLMAGRPDWSRPEVPAIAMLLGRGAS